MQQSLGKFSDNISFNRPYMTGKEQQYIAECYENGRLAGDGPFTDRCHKWLEKNTGCEKALLTHSCTAALEMAAILAEIQPGDEVIMPSYTFVSTANAFVLRGGVPVFVDIRDDPFGRLPQQLGQRAQVPVGMSHLTVSEEPRQNEYVIDAAATVVQPASEYAGGHRVAKVM